MEPLIVVDAGIPGAEAHFEGLGRLRLIPADAIRTAALRDAHAVVVRSVTRMDASLLEGTPVRFAGTATSGVDHVDRVWLHRHGIRFAHARGANAESVVDYVIAALLRVAARRGEPLAGRTVGIVGCGHVGGRLARRLPPLGMPVLLRDPPKDRRRKRAGRPSPYVSLDHLLGHADILTLHTPLTRHGRDATHHLVDADLLARVRPDAWLVNTARGPVVDSRALHGAGIGGGQGALILDVWEGEPLPEPDLVARADLATAHIAGYAVDSKMEATRRIAAALARHLGRPGPAAGRREPPIPVEAPHPVEEPVAWLDALVRRMYPIERDDAALRALMTLPDAERAARFEALRRGYPERRLFRRFGIDPAAVPPGLRSAVFHGLGLRRIRG